MAALFTEGICCDSCAICASDRALIASGLLPSSSKRLLSCARKSGRRDVDGELILDGGVEIDGVVDGGTYGDADTELTDEYGVEALLFEIPHVEGVP